MLFLRLVTVTGAKESICTASAAIATKIQQVCICSGEIGIEVICREDGGRESENTKGRMHVIDAIDTIANSWYNTRSVCGNKKGKLSIYGYRS